MTGNNLTKMYSTFVHGFIERVAMHLDALSHAGQKGTASERAVADLLRSFLPRAYSIKHDAVLVGTDHALSPQCDLALINDLKFPRMFPMDGVEMWPVDCCDAVIEVKSRLRKDELVQAMRHAEAVKKLRYNKRQIVFPTPHLPGGKGQTPTLPPLYVLWAWQSDANCIDTVLKWLSDAMSGGVYNHQPDFIFVADKAISLQKSLAWLPNSPTPHTKVPSDDLYQCGMFQVMPEEEHDFECKLDTDGKHVVRLSRGRAVLNVLWALITQIVERQHRRDFDPKSYFPAELRAYTKAPFTYFTSAGAEDLEDQ